MEILNELRHRMESTDSMFQRQLLKEDIARLEKLQLMALSSGRDTFLKEGFSAGWTKGDLRTFELREPLEEFLGAFYRCATTAEPTRDDEARLTEVWRAFDRIRLEKLIGCL